MTDGQQPPPAEAPSGPSPTKGMSPTAPVDFVPRFNSEDIADIAAEQGYSEPDLFVGPEGGRRVLRFEESGAAQVIARGGDNVVDEKTREQETLFASGRLSETMPHPVAPATPGDDPLAAPVERISRAPAGQSSLSASYEIGHATAPVYQRRSEWLSRRVEAIEFAAGGEVLRRLSVDFEIPDGLPHLDGLAAPGVQLVPVSSYRKWPPLSTFDFRSEDGQPLSLYRRITNNSLDFGLLVGMTELVSEPPSEELKAKLWGIVMADKPPNHEVERTVKSLAEHLKAHAFAGTAPDVPEVIDLAARLASSVILWAPVAGTPGTDRIIKFGYREEQERLGRWWNRILVSCSWRPRITWIQLPQAGLHTRHHVEVRAPDARGLVFLNAVTLAFPAFPEMLLTERKPDPHPSSSPEPTRVDSQAVRDWWRVERWRVRPADARKRAEWRGRIRVRTTFISTTLTRFGFSGRVGGGPNASSDEQREQTGIELTPAITGSVATSVATVRELERDQPPSTPATPKSTAGPVEAQDVTTAAKTGEAEDRKINVATQGATDGQSRLKQPARAGVVSEPDRPPSSWVQISNGDVFVYHPERAVPSHRMFMVLHTGASREGYVTTCALAVILLNLLMTVTLFHLKAVLAHLDATVVLLAALPALLGFAVLRPTEHELERAQTVGVRIMTLLAGSLPVLAMTMAVATHDRRNDFPEPTVVRPVWAGLVVLGWAIAIAISWSWLLAANPNESGARDRRLVKLAPDSAIGSAIFAAVGGFLLPLIYGVVSGHKPVSPYLLLTQRHAEQTLARSWLAIAVSCEFLFIAITAFGPLIGGFWRLLGGARPGKHRWRPQVVVGTGLLFALTSGVPLLILIWEALISSARQPLPDLDVVAHVVSDMGRFSAVFASIWIATSSLWLAGRWWNRHTSAEDRPDAGDVKSVAQRPGSANDTGPDARERGPDARERTASPTRRTGSERFVLALVGVVTAILWLAAAVKPAVAPALLPQWAALAIWLAIVWKSIGNDCRDVSPL
ncbi:MAG: hypothetical protein ACTHMY_05075 [Solirubrobacteraceae bacterium]